MNHATQTEVTIMRKIGRLLAAAATTAAIALTAATTLVAAAPLAKQPGAAPPARQKAAAPPARQVAAQAVVAPLPVVWSKSPLASVSRFATVDPAGNVITAEQADTGIVVTKYDARGAQLGSWTLADTHSVFAVASDPSGNMLVLSARTLTGLTADGAPNFSYTAGSPMLAMAVDPSGNIILAENSWMSDLVIEKLSSAGKPIFRKTFGSTGGIEDFNLATDSAGSIIAAAVYQNGAIDFGGGALKTSYADAMTVFVAKLSPDGGHVFSQIFNPTLAADGSHVDIYEVLVACNSQGEIFISGMIDGTGLLVMGSETITLAGDSRETMFLARFSPAGQAQFAKAIGVNGVRAEAIAIDKRDDVVITGEDWSARFLGAGYGVFVARFGRADGALQSSILIGNEPGIGLSVAVDAVSNDIVATGLTGSVSYLMRLAN